MRYCRAMDPRTHPPSSSGYDAAFVAQALDDALAHECRLYGIAGLQGTGKSTLAAQVAALAARQGRNVVVLSIDDFYLDLDARHALARDVHPLLATRGPPGTHDLPLAVGTLDALLAGANTPLPCFDKIEDRRLPQAAWPHSGHADLVILEGWFSKVPPQAEAELTQPLNALERDEDPDGGWRRFCNDALGRDYPPLWQRVDRLLFLQGPGFEVVPEWRWQQERTLQAANPGRRAMDRAQVLRFVQFFERVSRHALRTLPGIADRVVRLDAHRHPTP